MDDKSLRDSLEFACRTVQTAGEAILPHFRRQVPAQDKGGPLGYDPVTLADEAAERAIRDRIRATWPDDAIVGEEHGETRGASGRTWVIDPIDGTKAFVMGQLHWGTLLALNDGTGPVLGVMHQPYVGETFAGSRFGAEVRRGGQAQRLECRSCPHIEQAIVCTTDPAYLIGRGESEAFRSISERSRLTRYSGDCYLFALLAAGLIDIVIESGLKPYDIQPLIPIVEAAGGVVTTWAGGRADDGGQVLACGDRRLHETVLEMLAGAAASGH